MAIITVGMAITTVGMAVTTVDNGYNNGFDNNWGN